MPAVVQPQGPTAAQRVIAKLPPPGETLDACQIAHRTGLTPDQVRKACSKLVGGGLATREVTGMGSAWRLTRAGIEARIAGTVSKRGMKGPLTGNRKAPSDTLWARLWSALRESKRATVAELLVLAATGAERQAAGNARRYLRALESAGYVRRLKSRGPGRGRRGGPIVWVLLPDRNTGPRAPAWNPKRREVRDQNTGERRAV